MLDHFLSWLRVFTGVYLGWIGYMLIIYILAAKKSRTKGKTGLQSASNDTAFYTGDDSSV